MRSGSPAGTPFLHDESGRDVDLDDVGRPGDVHVRAGSDDDAIARFDQPRVAGCRQRLAPQLLDVSTLADHERYYAPLQRAPPGDTIVMGDRTHRTPRA